MAGSSITSASDYQFFRIGTGGAEGTYFPIGSLIAEAISDRAGHQLDSPYRVPSLLAMAQRSNGSVTNVNDISEGLLEAGLAQADVVHWAYHGTGPYTGEAPRHNLRGVAALYLEHVHLVVRKDSNITQITDLVGQRVSLDEAGSGTLLDIRAILESSGISTSTMETVYLKPTDAMERIREGTLDAFFAISGYPIYSLQDLVTEGKAEVLPLDGENFSDLTQKYPFFTLGNIPPNTYQNEQPITTLAVAAMLVIDSEIDAELVYKITGMLWSDATRKLLVKGHSKGAEVRIESALVGVDIPLHVGAQRYYREQGVLK